MNTASSHRGTRHPQPRRNPYASRGRRPRHSGPNRLPQLILVVLFIVLLIVIVSLISRCSKKVTTTTGEDTTEVSQDSTLEGETSDEESSEESVEEEVDPKNEDFSEMKGLDNVNTEAAHISSYYTYGTDLRIIGSMDALPNVANMELVLRYLGHEEDVCTLPLIWEAGTDTIDFKTGENLCDNINLEALPEGDFAWLIKLTGTDDSVMYKILDVEESIDAIDYYTITDSEGKNREIRMAETKDKVHDFSYVAITVHEAELPDDIYDVVVDAGHGGNDGGCSYGDYTEAELAFEVATRIKDDLEAQGYKVLMSRDGTESADEWMAFTMYDVPDGRVTKACASRAKYCVSIHLNSTEDDLDIGGIQVYSSVRGNHQFGINISNCLQEGTNCDVSTMTAGKVAEGVFYNIFSAYDNTDLFNNHDALFMVRELGGVATDANVTGDGTYNENIYRDSVQGVESDLVELGFITVQHDREDIIANTDAYGDSIAKAFILTIQEDQAAGVMDAVSEDEAADDSGSEGSSEAEGSTEDSAPADEDGSVEEFHAEE